MVNCYIKSKKTIAKIYSTNDDYTWYFLNNPTQPKIFLPMNYKRKLLLLNKESCVSSNFTNSSHRRQRTSEQSTQNLCNSNKTFHGTSSMSSRTISSLDSRKTTSPHFAKLRNYSWRSSQGMEVIWTVSHFPTSKPGGKFPQLPSICGFPFTRKIRALPWKIKLATIQLTSFYFSDYYCFSVGNILKYYILYSNKYKIKYTVKITIITFICY